MKKLCLILVVMLFAMGITGYEANSNSCATIKDGTILYPAAHYFAAQPLKIGFDAYGYNYQAHMFLGSYVSTSLAKKGFPPYEGDDVAYYERFVEEGFAESTAEAEARLLVETTWASRDVTLIMKWSDVWLSNKDCNGDGLLDRGYLCDPLNAKSSVCEGAWLTNHQSGTCPADEKGKERRWTYFVKMVAVMEEDAYKADKEGEVLQYWYTYDGVEIGSVVWGAYARILQISNDPSLGEHGVFYKSPIGPGWGKEW